MKRSLSELICDDLSELAHLGSEVVASEEAIRTMSQMDIDTGLLSNHKQVNKVQLEALLKMKMKDEGFLNTAAHYQFSIEVGARGKGKQGDPGTVHYCALDLYIRPGKKPLAFVADHYRGHDGYYSEFKEIAKNLGIQFVVVGGSHYQADDVHCPIFTHKHLQLSAADRGLLPLLENIVGTKEDSVMNFNWNQLSPEYLMFSQSVSMLFKYVDTVKERENSAKDQSSAALMNSLFAQKMGRSLYPLIPTNSKEEGDRDKVRNKGVKYLAAELAGKVVVELEKDKPPYTEAQLIDICYKDSYPLVHEILHKALIVQNQNPGFDKSKIEVHPMFELAFSHAGILETCLKNPKFYKIFNTPTALVLMQKGLIDPHKLFAKLTITPKDTEISKAPCNQVASNLLCIETLFKEGLNATKVNEDEILTLLVSTKIIAFCKNKFLVELLVKGLIPIQMVERIAPYQIEKDKFEQMDNVNRVKYLSDKFPLIASSKLGLTADEDDTSELLSVPDVSSVPAKCSDAGKAKPEVHVGLLIQSMSKSVFTPVVENPEQEKIDLSLTVKV
jgi:hypothetical protein